MATQDPQPISVSGIVRFAVWLTFFNTWVLFEETVVDRYGLWEYMPVLPRRPVVLVGYRRDGSTRIRVWRGFRKRRRA